MIDDLKARVRELSDPDVEVLADPQRPCELRDHRVADELVTALAREVQALRASKRMPAGGYAVSEPARTVTVYAPGGRPVAWYTFDHLADAGRVAGMRSASEAFPDGLAAAWLRARVELIRRGLIAGEGVAGD